MSTRIQKIEITNLKAVSNLVADFKGCTAIITGGNNKGKTTLLRGIVDRIRGDKPKQIVKNGEKEGKGILTLTTGEKFEWDFSDSGAEKLVYISKEGFSSSVSKELSKKFFPELFDIDIFLNTTPKEQSKMLQALAGVDFTRLNDAYKNAFESRTIANRMEKEAKARLKNYNESVGLELSDVSALEQEVGGVTTHNELFKQMNKKHADDKKRLVELQEEVSTLEKTIAKGAKWVNDANNKPKDIEELNKKLTTLKEKNEEITLNIAAKQSLDDYNKRKAEAQAADENVLKVEKAKAERMKEANFPSGITLNDEQILIDGFPLDKTQISTSKLYCTALRLASLKLGEVRTLHFDASSLDKNTLSEIENWANENDCQLLIERPDFDGGDIRYEILCKQ